MSTVVQLSLLAAMHKRDQLASIIANAMSKRIEAGVPGANLDPGYAGILSTLTAISSQTARYQWCHLTSQIEATLRKGITSYRFSPDYIRVTPALMLGIVDAFYAVQSLPVDRKIAVSNETGVVTLVAWAHHILGYDVIIVGEVDEPICFGTCSSPQVTITWTQARQEAEISGFVPSYPLESNSQRPELQLLDADSAVLIKYYPNLEFGYDEIRGQDRHILAGWGTTLLHRALNTQVLIQDDDQIHEQIVKDITARTLFALNRLYRVTRFTPGSSATQCSKAPETELQKAKQFRVELEAWRVTRAVKILFEGINIENIELKAIDECV